MTNRPRPGTGFIISSAGSLSAAAAVHIYNAGHDRVPFGLDPNGTLIMPPVISRPPPKSASHKKY